MVLVLYNNIFCSVLILFVNLILLVLRIWLKKSFGVELSEQFKDDLLVAIFIILVVIWFVYWYIHPKTKKIIVNVVFNVFLWVFVSLIPFSLFLLLENPYIMEKVVHNFYGFIIIKHFWPEEQILAEALRYITSKYGEHFLSLLNVNLIIQECDHQMPELHAIIDRHVNSYFLGEQQKMAEYIELAHKYVSWFLFFMFVMNCPLTIITSIVSGCYYGQ